MFTEQRIEIIGFVITVWFEGSENCILVTAFKADSLE